MVRAAQLLIAVVPALVAGAQPFEIDWRTTDGGGVALTGGDFGLSSTVGQPDAATLSGTGPDGAFELSGGFWAGAAGAPACLGDFDHSGGTPDVNDIDAFFAAWLAGEPSADADASGGTPDANDIDEFFTHWLAGC